MGPVRDGAADFGRARIFNLSGRQVEEEGHGVMCYLNTAETPGAKRCCIQGITRGSGLVK